MYTPRTGAKCGCKRGVMRDNCPNCEGTGFAIDFRAIHARREAEQRERQLDIEQRTQDAKDRAAFALRAAYLSARHGGQR